MSRAVIVIELDVVENSTDVTEAARVIGEAGVPSATRLHMAIRDAAEGVLAVLAAAEGDTRVTSPANSDGAA